MKKRVIALTIMVVLIIANIISFSMQSDNTSHALEIYDWSDCSPWAQEEVKEAVTTAKWIGSITKGKPNQAITRKGFCTYLADMLMAQAGLFGKTTGKGYYDLLDYYGVSYDIMESNRYYSDTSDPCIYVASKLGIVNGIGNNKFNPDGAITRQEAATMLIRATKVMKKSPNVATIRYTDLDKAGKWARDNMTAISGYRSSTGKQVMNGVGNNMFDPLGTYTVEQAIITIRRMELVP